MQLDGVRGRMQWHLRQEMGSYAQIAMPTIHGEFHLPMGPTSTNSARQRLYKKEFLVFNLSAVSFHWKLQG